MALRKVFAVLCSSSCVTVLAASVFIAGACGGSEPRLSLLQVMYMIDFEDQRMRSALGRGDLPQVLDAGNNIRRHHEDAAFERYLERPNLPAPIARFNEYQTGFLSSLDEVLAAAQSGDLAGANRVYPRMRMACEICHRDFRPGL